MHKHNAQYIRDGGQRNEDDLNECGELWPFYVVSFKGELKTVAFKW